MTGNVSCGEVGVSVRFPVCGFVHCFPFESMCSSGDRYLFFPFSILYFVLLNNLKLAKAFLFSYLWLRSSDHVIVTAWWTIICI